MASDGKDMTHVLGGRSAALKKLVDGGRLPLDTPDNRGVGHSECVKSKFMDIEYRINICKF